MNKLLIGIIGKSNVGKSTFFNAATSLGVQTANFPFTTVEPNIGIGYVKTGCVCREFQVQDNPLHSMCIGGSRYIPIKILDIAGLVPGAHNGRGLGNQFLDSAREADALVHVIDAAGSTDSEGRAVSPGTGDPLHDAEFVLEEFDMWLVTHLKKKLMSSRDSQGSSDSMQKVLSRQLSGMSVRESQVAASLNGTGLGNKKLSSWSEADLLLFCRTLRRFAKPMIIAANKADIMTAEPNLEKLKSLDSMVVPCVSEAEVMLRLGSRNGMLRYSPGDNSFEILPNTLLREDQKKALDKVRAVLTKYGSTGVQTVLNGLCFVLLGMIVVYPVEDENRLTDKKGNVLPDAYLLPKESTAKDLAKKVHEQLGKGFLYAIDVRTKQRVGAEHKLKDRDIIKIVSATSRR
ncbi:MAG TPA: redox-regulated ATPase YchF [Nitrososphaeraceae archaeon]|nr:redox-regulated ATPase YchF [Nitrososphaeraceae archaeon]